jgi:hypothetical protein
VAAGVQCDLCWLKENTVRMLKKVLRGHGSSNAAIASAFLLCGLYFASWYLITHWSIFPSLY